MNTYINIPGLYEIKSTDREKMFATLINAFEDYPKMEKAFTDKETLLSALEATIRFYGAYDLHYGKGYSLDDTVSEVVLIVHSNEMNYNPLRHFICGSYSRSYRAAMRRLSSEDRQTRIRLFRELDVLESEIDIPKPHLYIDFLGTAKKYQGRGRGRKLMEAVVSYANHTDLPIMLFTNTPDDVKFYQSLGFKTIDTTTSAEFGFINTYLIYDYNSI